MIDELHPLNKAHEQVNEIVKYDSTSECFCIFVFMLISINIKRLFTMACRNLFEIF